MRFKELPDSAMLSNNIDSWNPYDTYFFDWGTEPDSPLTRFVRFLFKRKRPVYRSIVVPVYPNHIEPWTGQICYMSQVVFDRLVWVQEYTYIRDRYGFYWVVLSRAVKTHDLITVMALYGVDEGAMVLSYIDGKLNYTWGVRGLDYLVRSSKIEATQAQELIGETCREIAPALAQWQGRLIPEFILGMDEEERHL